MVPRTLSSTGGQDGLKIQEGTSFLLENLPHIERPNSKTISINKADSEFGGIGDRIDTKRRPVCKPVLVWEILFACVKRIQHFLYRW